MTIHRLSFEEFLRQNGYTDTKLIPGDRYAAIFQFMFTHAIIVGCVGDVMRYDDRWCYGSYDKAKAALDAWDGTPGTEPDGWHRHPATGRRRDEAGVEYINP